MLRYEQCAAQYFTLKNTEDYYFLSFHGRQLTNSAVEHIIKRHGEGIEGVRVSPHTCRHFYAQQQIKMGTDLYTISRLLGHENVQITQTYLNSLRDEDVINCKTEECADEYVNARSWGADNVTGYSCSEREIYVNNQENLRKREGRGKYPLPFLAHFISILN